MTIFPIVDRELRVLSRKGSLYWSRLLFAGLAIVGSLLLLSIMRHRPPSEVSRLLFGFLAVLAFLYCWASGVWITSDCLSGEKRNNTLGLLFLTDLKGYDVALGKMAAISLHSIYGVAAMFPVLAIPLLLGGVGFAEFCRLMLSLFLTLLLSLSVGVGVSSISRSAVASALAVFFAMLFFSGGGPALALFLEISTKVHFPDLASKSLLVTSLVVASFWAMEQSYNQFSHEYWISIGFNAALILGMLVLACCVIQRAWREGNSAFGRLRRREWRRWRECRRRLFRHSAVGDKNPIFWLQSRLSGHPAWVMLVFVLGGLYWIWGSLQFERSFAGDGDKYVFNLVTLLVMQLIIKCWAGVEAARRFGEERRSGALELLLCTPLSVREILRGQMQSLRRQFFWPAFVLLLLWFLFLATLIPRWGASGFGFQVLMILGTMVLLVLDLYALCWLGMWKGLNSRFVSRAILANLLTILLLPCLFFGLIMSMALSSTRGSISDNFPLVLWLLIGHASSYGWLYWGHSQLTARFRSVAAGERPA